MKPQSFEYVAPTTLDEALDLLAEHADAASVLAGGQSLLPLLNLRLARPELLIDINRLPGLDRLELTAASPVGPAPAGDAGQVGPAPAAPPEPAPAGAGGSGLEAAGGVGGAGSAGGVVGGLRVGALVRHRALEGAPEPGPLGRLLARVAPRVGHPPIRNRGTVCGSLAHADPAAEWCLVGLAAGAEVGLASAAGSRRLTVDALLDSPFATDRRPDELITEVTFPRWAPAEVGCGFVERARTAGSFAQAAACVVVRWAGPGAGADDVVAVRIAVAGFGGRPVLLPGAAAALVGRPLTGGQSAAAAAAAAAEITPRDGAGPAGHQRAVVAALVADALDRSARDRGGPDRTDLNGAGRPRLDLAG